MKSGPPKLALIFPCYNEEEVLLHSWEIVNDLLHKLKVSERIAPSSFVLFVDDGSKDYTWKIIERLVFENPDHVHGLKLAGNVGHQNALYAGMMNALYYDFDCSVTLDVDLQDDIYSLDKMLEQFQNGSDVVYGIRAQRDSDRFFKRQTARLFYAIMSMLNVSLIAHHADYRLCSKRVVESLAHIKETELFLRAIFPSLGFTSSTVEYARKKREYGKSKYPLRKMLSFAWRGITSFSATPLRISGLLSLCFFIISVIQGFYVLVTKISGEPVPGWSSLMLVVLILGSIQLFCLTIIGEYVAKIFWKPSIDLDILLKNRFKLMDSMQQYRYDSSFFDFVEESSGRSAHLFLSAIQRVFLPQSVLDVGCGTGVWLTAWNKLGVLNTYGVDGYYVSQDRIKIDKERYTPLDISKPFDLGKRFDLVQCLEVAEHIDARNADILVDNLARHGDIILFSAAQPGQGGEFHVNEQALGYWLKKFEKRGYDFFDYPRMAVKEYKNIEPWYRFNSVLLATANAQQKLPPEVLSTKFTEDSSARYMTFGWKFRCACLRIIPRTIIHWLARVKHVFLNLRNKYIVKNSC